MNRTSVLDVGAYREFCYSASRYSEVFHNFRNHPVFRWAVEYATPQQGANYLEKIFSNVDFKISKKLWDKFLKNDSVGNPLTFEFRNRDNGGAVTCSPTTLRYIKVLSDLVTYFNVDEIKTVAEIGIGYGGQCKILKNFFQIDTYNLIDLPETLALSEKFLNAVNLSNGLRGLRFIDGTHLYHEVDSDLFISNYAFSELQKSVQDMYIEKVVSKSKAGYITWDAQFSKAQYGINGYTLDEFLKKIPDAEVIPEEPVSTSPDNRIIIWGNK